MAFAVSKAKCAYQIVQPYSYSQVVEGKRFIGPRNNTILSSIISLSAAINSASIQKIFDKGVAIVSSCSPLVVTR